MKIEVESSALESIKAMCESLQAERDELLDAANDLLRVAIEAMKTGGWVPTPLHESFWGAMQDVQLAIAKCTQEQPVSDWQERMK